MLTRQQKIGIEQAAEAIGSAISPETLADVVRELADNGEGEAGAAALVILQRKLGQLTAGSL